MYPRWLRLTGYLVVLLLFVPSWSNGQSFKASIGGTVTDPSGAVVPSAECTLRAVATEAVRKVTSGTDGLFRFENLQQGIYDLEVNAKGFQTYVQRGISLNINTAATVKVALQVGSSEQQVEVTADASPLNFETATQQGTITPEVLANLPLQVAGSSRSAAAFVVLMPGVSTGTTGDPFNARINGGMLLGGEASLDGASMQEGIMGQSGMNAIHGDYPLSPEAMSEVTVLTSNYSPQYGSSDSGIINMVTKSGTDKFHGDLREFHRNTVLNARQWGVPERPSDIENQFGGSIGGPVKIPKLWSEKNKAYFFFNYERYTVRGGNKFPILSIPSMQERLGDFSDWRDADGNLIPVYDPATTRVVDGEIVRDQFMGCDGKSPNVICPSDPRMQNSLAPQWLQHLPIPTFSGPLNNYISPVPIPEIAGAGTDHRQNFDFRFDDYLGSKDHFALTLHNHNYVSSYVSNLPPIISSEGFLLPDGGEIGPWNDRISWDHTFSPNLLNSMTYGYMNMRGSEIAVDAEFAGQLPQIAGVASHAQPPAIQFSAGFESMGQDLLHHEDRPTSVFNDLLTWVRGRHTFKFGGEIRKLQNNFQSVSNRSGTFSFSEGETGLLGINSGNPIASFLLGAVDYSSAAFDTVTSSYSRGSYWALFAGDTWKATNKLSIDYGLRWDLGTPATEKWNRSSFLDPLGANPGAGGRPGRMAFAGSGVPGGEDYGAAGFSRTHPEHTWYRGFAPRLGIAYAWDPKTVVRAGYGIFLNQAFYPGWGSGITQDGFNANPEFGSTNGGLTPAFLLQEGFPQDFQRPPFIDSTFLNGQYGPLYRPFDANRRTYAQAWNLTVEREFTDNFYVSLGYVANKGTRLPSTGAPLNALDPKYLSMGSALYDEFEPGQTTLNGVSIPYDGWAEQMQSCAPSVAQALLPYPQYCGGLQGLNENAGNSTYHSFQAKVEHRFSKGLWFLSSYTLSKLITDSDTTQSGMFQGSLQGVISPFERQRNKSLSVMDTLHNLAVSFTYELPVGQGKRFLNRGGVVDKLLGGWQTVSIFRATSGSPFFFRSSFCNVPEQFQAACIPAVRPGVDPFLQDPGNFDPDKGPLFNKAAFEDPNSFNFYFGQGPRISNLRGPGLHNEDFSLVKKTRITETTGLQFRADFFNLFNWHTFTPTGYYFGDQAFDTDVASPDFGQWTGAVSFPRSIQFGLQFLF